MTAQEALEWGLVDSIVGKWGEWEAAPEADGDHGGLTARLRIVHGHCLEAVAGGHALRHRLLDQENRGRVRPDNHRESPSESTARIQ